MVSFVNQEIQEKAQEFLNVINKELPNGMELEFEGFFQRGFL